MEAWLAYALDYVRSWIEFQMRATQQPGCIVAIVQGEKLVAEYAFGVANLATGEKLTPRHRFRIASHSKAFTAAGILKLCEQKKLRLDDRVGTYVKGLHPRLADATIAQLLSHSAGVARDGIDARFYSGGRPFPDRDELLRALRKPPPIEANTRFKYSNFGYGLLGLMIEATTSEDYRSWVEREIIRASGLKETSADMPITKRAKFARGHLHRVLLGKRVVTPGDYSEDALAPCGGVVSTAADTARFFASLSPKAKRSVLSAASRREMVRGQWRAPHTSEKSYYGLGITSGVTAGWNWFGHGGGLEGYISRTCVVPACDLTIAILGNSGDSWAGAWVEGALRIMRVFASRGAPSARMRDWGNRWWGPGGAIDLVPIGDRVLVANPHGLNPFLDATEIKTTGKNHGQMVEAPGYASFGEGVRRVRDARGRPAELWLGPYRLQSEKKAAADLERRLGRRRRW